MQVKYIVIYYSIRGRYGGFVTDYHWNHCWIGVSITGVVLLVIVILVIRWGYRKYQWSQYLKHLAKNKVHTDYCLLLLVNGLILQCIT